MKHVTRDRPQDHSRLAQFVKSRNLTQAQFAARIGMRRETISRMISGNEPITDSFIGKFFLAFGAETTAQVFGDQPVAQSDP